MVPLSIGRGYPRNPVGSDPALRVQDRTHECSVVFCRRPKFTNISAGASHSDSSIFEIASRVEWRLPSRKVLYPGNLCDVP